MSQRVTLICEWCRVEQPEEDERVYWAERIRQVYWKVPDDGINGGEFDGELCRLCRAAFISAIEVARLDRIKRGREKNPPVRPPQGGQR